MLPAIDDERGWENYLYRKSLESYETQSNEWISNRGDIENLDPPVGSVEWYWKGCSPEMNKEIS